jgi:hypothetical protein
MNNMVGKGSMDRWSGEKFHIRAQVVESLLAKLAFVASNAWLKSYPITHCNILHSLPNFLNGTSTFMANNHGFLHYKIPTLQVPVIMDIAAANTYSFDSHFHFMVTKNGWQIVGLHFQVVLPANPHCHVLASRSIEHGGLITLGLLQQNHLLATARYLHLFT